MIMSCFIVPAAEAVVTTIVTKVIEHNEKKQNEGQLKYGMSISSFSKEGFSKKLKRLNHLLWGGTGLLAFEHLWHGEIQPFFPFVTAASNPVDTAEMLKEMSTVGVSMAVLVTVVWGIMTYVTSLIESRKDELMTGMEAKGVH